MVRVALYDLLSAGIIISYPTGVTYSNQTGGTSNLQPELEGCLVPLPEVHPDKVPPDKILAIHFSGPKWRETGATSGIDTEDADLIDALLNDCRLSGIVKVDRSKLKESHEAWVFIQILNDDPGNAFSGFDPYPRVGVLTWSNSD